MRLLFASVLLAYPVSALAIEVTASPNATMNDAMALGSKIDVTAAVAQAAYNALSTQVSTLSTNLTNLQNSYNSLLSCSSSLKFFNGSSCLNPPTGGGGTPTGPDPNLTALLACQAQYKFYNGSACVEHPIINRQWYDVSPRTYGTTRSNTYAWPIEVTAGVWNGGRKCSINVAVNGVMTGKNRMNQPDGFSSLNSYCFVYATVPPGGYYTISSDEPGVTMSVWRELR